MGAIRNLPCLARTHYFDGGPCGPGLTSLGASPITVLSGQTESAGHFWHPATIAIGHRVMSSPFRRSAAAAYAARALGATSGPQELVRQQE